MVRRRGVKIYVSTHPNNDYIKGTVDSGDDNDAGNSSSSNTIPAMIYTSGLLFGARCGHVCIFMYQNSVRSLSFYDATSALGCMYVSVCESICHLLVSTHWNEGKAAYKFHFRLSQSGIEKWIRR